MAEIIFLILFVLPIIILLILSIIYPETMATWGYSLKYKEEPEPTEGYIKYVRYVSLVALLFIFSFVILSFSRMLGLISLMVTLAIMFYLIVLKK